MKKPFVAPVLRVEARLSRLTLQLVALSSPQCEGNACDALDG